MHDRLLRSPESFRVAPSTLGITAVALVVLIVAAALLAGLVWFTVIGDGFLAHGLAAVGWLAVLASVRHPSRLPKDTKVLSVDEAPHTFRLVRDVAAAVGVRPPDVIGVDTSFNAYVMQVGWRRRNAIVLGLPLWVALADQERLATLGHELGHLLGRDTRRSRLVGGSLDLLARWHDMLHPGHVLWVGDNAPDLNGESDEVAILEGLARFTQSLLAFPLGLALVLAVRLDARSRQHREYLADRRAAALAGPQAMASALSLDIVGLHTETKSAVTRGQDPFECLESLQSGVRTIFAAPSDTVRADDTHPPTHLRISLLERTPDVGTRDGAATTALHGADHEMRRLRPELVARFRDELRVTWY